MNIQEDKQEKGVIKLTITIPPEKYEKFLRGTALILGEKISIPGFRSGKAPYEIVARHVGDMQLLQEALNDIVKDTYTEAIKEKHYTVAFAPKINVTKVAPGNALEYTADIIILPEVTLPDISKISVTENRRAVTDEDVRKALEELQKMRGKETATVAGSEKGDKIECDIITKLEKDNTHEETAKNQTIILGETKMIPGFDEKITGAKKEDSKEFTLTFPSDYQHKPYAGHQVRITVKIHNVWKVEKPELNDTFAQDVNPTFTSLQKLKDELKHNIAMDRKEKHERDLERQIFDAIIAHGSFGEIAEELLKDAQEKIVDEVKANIANQGLEWNAYLERVKKKEEDLKVEFKDEAIKRLKMDATIATIIDREGLTVTDEEIQKEMNMFLSMYPSATEAKEKIDVPKLKASLEGKILNRKAVEFLKSKMTINKK